jgi:hypothetical protein
VISAASRLASSFIADSQAAADGAQQREAGHGQHQFLRERGDQPHHRAAGQQAQAM